MKKEEFTFLAMKYKSGHCSHQEKVLYEKVIAKLNQEESLDPQWDQVTKAQIRKKIISRIERKQLEKKLERKRKKRGSWQIAATILIILGVGFSIYFIDQKETKTNYITKTTDPGQRSTITLSDGTRVTLNSKSNLTYPTQFSTNTREIFLDGEAYFEVERDPDRPFVIHSQEVKTTVLGTSFNIRSFDKEKIEVTVSSGMVNVSTHETGKEVLISKGQQATYTRITGKLDTMEVDPKWSTSWIHRSLEFDMMPFSKVISILSRTYNTEIKIKGVNADQCLIRGKYDDERLLNILDGLKLVVNFDYIINEENIIIINGKGCIN